jgi:hypothetical protein
MMNSTNDVLFITHEKSFDHGSADPCGKVVNLWPDTDVFQLRRTAVDSCVLCASYFNLILYYFLFSICLWYKLKTFAP